MKNNVNAIDSAESISLKNVSRWRITVRLDRFIRITNTSE